MLTRLIRHLGYVRGPWIASRLRRAWVIARNPQADIQIDKRAYLGPGFDLFIPDNGTFVAGPGTQFRRGFHAEGHGDGRVEIGAGCVFTYYSLIQCSTLIEIGERCMFGQSSIVLDGQHRFRDLTKPMLAQGYDFNDIRIEDDVTTTTKCTIMASIGRRAFLGANSVVTKPIPAYTVAVGAPAKPIEYFGPPGAEPAGLQ